ncbi:MAG: aminopeptidase N [Actinomycetota bacterium]
MSEPGNNLTRTEATARALAISDVSYEVFLDVTADETYISETTIRFASKQDSVFVDFLAKTVDSITLNGSPVDVGVFHGSRIHLDGLTAHNVLTVVAHCEYSNAGIGLHRFVDPADGLVYLYSDLEPFEAHRAYACFDQPDIKATFDFIVAAPLEWTVISNCKALSSEGGIWKFVTTPILSTYVTAICAGPYHHVSDHHNGVDLGIYCRQSLAEFLDPDEIFAVTKAGFDFFNSKFDYPYMIDKYDHVFCPQYNQGAMENFGCITVNELYIFRSKVTGTVRERRAESILHELAHMWFGDLVTMRWWEDLWLNESFATYEAMMAQNAATSYKNGWTTFATSWKTWAYNADQLPTTHPVATKMIDTDSVSVNFDGISYAKGCSVLRQLVAWVGEEAFNKGLRGYFKEHEYANAELKDFLSALETASGRSLSSWSKLWLETAGVNTLNADFTLKGDVFDSFIVTQDAPEGHPTLRPHRLGIGLYDRVDGRITLRRRVEVEIDGPSTDIPELVGETRSDLVLLNDGDLTYAKIRFDERSLRTLVEGIGDLDDSLTRAMCWAAAWDMVRDAEMGSSDYLDMVLTNLAGEEIITLVDSTLLKCQTVMRYLTPDKLAATRDKFAHGAFEAAARATPGGDRQLSWTRTFIGNARSEHHLSMLKEWLEGTSIPEGLGIDTDLRWMLVTVLAGNGAAGQGLIDAELARDDTENGKRHAIGAHASMPDAAVKAEVFKTVIEDRDLALDRARTMMAYGFARLDQRDLLEPYVAKYFDALKHVADSRDVQFALAFATSVFPSAVISESTLQAADEFLAKDLVPAHIARVVREGRDEMARCLHARRRVSQDFPA